MTLPPDPAYQALLSHDARFDGRMFVGVSSTGIYCRPVCRVRPPKREHCTFFANAAEAEAAGFRPCLRCRPELAPGCAPMDAASGLARRLALALQPPGDAEALADLPARFGVSERHLRRVFAAEFGVSPIAFLQTQRLLTAKRLLTDTGLPMTEVAAASGFASLRRFNALFHDHYGLKPSDLRRGRSLPDPGEGFRFRLPYRPPYDGPRLMGFLGLRAVPGVESCDGVTYRRTAALEWRGKRHAGWIEARVLRNENALEAVLSPSLGPVIPQVLARLSRLFDLGGLPGEVQARLGDLAAPRPGLRVPGTFEGFEFAAQALLGPPGAEKAAQGIAERLGQTFGEAVATPFPELRWTFPSPRRLAEASLEELGSLGLPRARACSLRALARAVAERGLRLEPDEDVEAALATLLALPGIGPGTAGYLAMRALAWPDAFLPDDPGVRRALPGLGPREIMRRAEAWRPWRAYAVMHLWASLEDA